MNVLQVINFMNGLSDPFFKTNFISVQDEVNRGLPHFPHMHGIQYVL